MIVESDDETIFSAYLYDVESKSESDGTDDIYFLVTILRTYNCWELRDKG